MSHTEVPLGMTMTDADVEMISRSITDTYADTELKPTLIVDGFGVSVTVYRGQLTVKDGIGENRRIRTLARIDRTVRRLVVLSESGTVSLDALTWCSDVGISVHVVDRTGRLKLISATRKVPDARLLRAQALAPSTGFGHSIASQLLTLKLEGQADVLRTMLDSPEAADRFIVHYEGIQHAETTADLMAVESNAASEYFGVWADAVRCHFASNARARVPDHWHRITTRKSELTAMRSPFKATRPINALLNYAYSVGMAECITACTIVGLEPTLGVLHMDKPHRDSMALDLLEPIRPIIDRKILELLTVRNFSAVDFTEDNDGSCRLSPSITHTITSWMPSLRTTLGPIAESVAHTIMDSASGKIGRTTPITGKNRKHVVARRPKKSEPVITTVLTCETCGAILKNASRKLCEVCWPIRRKELAAQNLGKAGTSKGHTDDWRALAQTPEAQAKRVANIAKNRQEKIAWESANPGYVVDVNAYRTDIQPHLATLTTSRIARALGVSDASASRIRSGKLIPHVRHWPALSNLTRPATEQTPN